MSRKTKNDNQGVATRHTDHFRLFSSVFSAMGKGRGKSRRIEQLMAGEAKKKPENFFNQRAKKSFGPANLI